MSNLIALEWDDAEARIAVADSRRGSVVLEQAFSVALPKDKTSPEASGATGTISISGAHDLGAIGRRINDGGRAYLTPSVLDGKQILRVSIGAERTERAHVAALWVELREAAAAV